MLYCVARTMTESFFCIFNDFSGLAHLLPAFAKLGASLSTLKLSRASLSARGINRLAETLLCETGFLTTLQCLDLSDNSTKGEDVTVSESCTFLH
jgi:hypothetical protein